MDGFNSPPSSNYPTYGQPPSGGEYGGAPGSSGPTPSPLARPPGPPGQNSQQPPQHPGMTSFTFNALVKKSLASFKKTNLWLVLV